MLELKGVDYRPESQETGVGESKIKKVADGGGEVNRREGQSGQRRCSTSKSYDEIQGFKKCVYRSSDPHPCLHQPSCSQFTLSTRPYTFRSHGRPPSYPRSLTLIIPHQTSFTRPTSSSDARNITPTYKPRCIERIKNHVARKFVIHWFQ